MIPKLMHHDKTRSSFHAKCHLNCMFLVTVPPKYFQKFLFHFQARNFALAFSVTIAKQQWPLFKCARQQWMIVWRMVISLFETLLGNYCSLFPFDYTILWDWTVCIFLSAKAFWRTFQYFDGDKLIWYLQANNRYCVYFHTLFRIGISMKLDWIELVL